MISVFKIILPLFPQAQPLSAWSRTVAVVFSLLPSVTLGALQASVRFILLKHIAGSSFSVPSQIPSPFPLYSSLITTLFRRIMSAFCLCAQECSLPHLCLWFCFLNLFFQGSILSPSYVSSTEKFFFLSAQSTVSSLRFLYTHCWYHSFDTKFSYLCCPLLTNLCSQSLISI